MAKSTEYLKDEVKKVIRAVLESAPHDIYLHTFLGEYRKVVREYLPIRQLGYKNLEDLMLDIGDTVMLREDDKRGTLMSIVPGTNTIELERLVRTHTKNTMGKSMVAPQVPQVQVTQMVPQQPWQYNVEWSLKIATQKSTTPNQ